MRKNAKQALSLAFCLIMLLAAVKSTVQASAYNINLAEVMQAKRYADLDISKNATMPYRLYLPESYSVEKSYSLLVHIHGAGERGNNNSSQIASDSQTALMRRIISDSQLREQFIIVAPQCPSDDIWVTYDWYPGTYSIKDTPQTQSMRLLVSLLQKEIIRNYSVDTKRIYVTGLSAGGYATWDLVCRYPHMFAAAIPVCGGCDTSYAEVIKDIPIRIYHSENDTIVLNKGSVKMFSLLSELGSDVVFTDTAPYGHDAWIKAYSDKELIQWMISKVGPGFEIDRNNDTSDISIESSGTHEMSENSSVKTGVPDLDQKEGNGFIKVIIPCVSIVLILIIFISSIVKKRNT